MTGNYPDGVTDRSFAEYWNELGPRPCPDCKGYDEDGEHEKGCRDSATCDSCDRPCNDLHGGRDQYVNERLVAVPAVCCCCRYSQEREWLGDRATLDACESCGARTLLDVRRRA